MALSFKVKAISRSKFLKNFFLSFILLLSFLLIFFSKSDYIVINKFNQYQTTFTYNIFIVAPVKIFLVSKQYYEFRNLKAENTILKEEIMRLKK